MAIDPNKKFLYFNKDSTSGEMDEALCFPVSSFIGAETQSVESVPKSIAQGNSLQDQIDADVANIKKKYFEGMEPNTTQNYNTVNNVSTNNMAKSDAILPHMSNKNTDKTVIDIQDVF